MVLGILGSELSSLRAEKRTDMTAGLYPLQQQSRSVKIGGQMMGRVALT